jgi:hypothetical protein
MGTENQYDDNHDHDHDHDKHCRDHDDDKRCRDRDHDHDKRCRDRDHDDDRSRCREHYKYREYWKCHDSDGGKGHHHDKDDDKHREHMSHHIHELEKTIKTLADKLAELGRGAHLLELQRVIHWPGWTSPAELAFVNAILDHLSVEVRTIERLQADLVEASRKVKKDRD